MRRCWMAQLGRQGSELSMGWEGGLFGPTAPAASKKYIFHFYLQPFKQIKANKIKVEDIMEANHLAEC